MKRSSHLEAGVKLPAVLCLGGRLMVTANREKLRLVEVVSRPALGDGCVDLSAAVSGTIVSRIG